MPAQHGVRLEETHSKPRVTVPKAHSKRCNDTQDQSSSLPTNSSLLNKSVVWPRACWSGLVRAGQGGARSIRVNDQNELRNDFTAYKYMYKRRKKNDMTTTNRALGGFGLCLGGFGRFGFGGLLLGMRLTVLLHVNVVLSLPWSGWTPRLDEDRPCAGPIVARTPSWSRQ